MRNLSLITLLFLVLFSACKKDKPIIDTPTNSPIENWKPVIENVNGSLVGQVNNDSGSPINNATVTLNNETTTTNQYGFFFFENTVMNSKGSYVKVEKNGYFLGSRRFFPQANVRTNVKITLLRKTFSQSFLSDSEALMEFEGASVKFPANSIATSNGEAYTGHVNFAAKWLDPSSPEVFAEMPGNLQGVNTGSEEVALQTLGMIAVELEDDSGNELNILSGNTATISVPVPEELRTNAPAQIPLWSFDEEYGMWVEEGMASLQNGSYVGEVAHFSFWNCDIPADYVTFSVTININEGMPLVDGSIILNSQSLGSGYSNLDENGSASGFIPANQTLNMKIFHDACDAPILEQIVGPFSEDTDIGTVTIENINVTITTITGTLVDCMDNPVSNGFLKIDNEDDPIYYFFENSNFVHNHVTCIEGPISVTGIDLENGTTGMPVDLVLGTENNVGNLSACGDENSVDFIRFSIDDETRNYPVTEVTHLENDSTYIFSQLPDEQVYVQIRFAGLEAGSYGQGDNYFQIYDPLNPWSFYFSSGSFQDFEVIEEANGKLSGTMSGEFSDGMGEIKLVEGEFLITPPE